MADIHLECDECEGKRFKDEVLDVKYHEKDVHDILDMTINQALAFFNQYENEGSVIRKIGAKLKPLQDVGLGYLKVGQQHRSLVNTKQDTLEFLTFTKFTEFQIEILKHLIRMLVLSSIKGALYDLAVVTLPLAPLPLHGISCRGYRRYS